MTADFKHGSSIIWKSAWYYYGIFSKTTLYFNKFVWIVPLFAHLSSSIYWQKYVYVHRTWSEKLLRKVEAIQLSCGRLVVLLGCTPAHEILLRGAPTHNSCKFVIWSKLLVWTSKTNNMSVRLSACKLVGLFRLTDALRVHVTTNTGLTVPQT